ncbi:MAG TPA: ATP-grasp domain-containing protein, partial [Burkholderiales bacterium]
GIEAPMKAEISAAIDRIVAETRLVGLNGLDFIAHEQGWSAIEINPRPTASMEYYDADWPRGLLAAHVEACEGRLPAAVPPASRIRGHAVIFAGRPVAVRPGLRFPDWCRDIPNPGTLIPAGGPVCTVHAEAADGEGVRRLIGSRRSELQSLLFNEAAA